MSLLRSESNSTDTVFRFRLAETFKQQLVNETTTRERHRVQITLGTQGSLLIPVSLHAVRAVLRIGLAETFEQQLVNETTTRERLRVQVTLSTLSSVLLTDCLTWGRCIRKRYGRSRCICSRCTVRGWCFSTCWCVSAWCVRRAARNRQQPDNNRNRHNSSHTTHPTHLLGPCHFSPVD